MKCKDVSELLEGRELSSLSSAEAAELELHISRCVECAEQCLASELVMSMRCDVPTMPESLHERVRDLYASCESSIRLHRTRRPLIVGSLLLLGATATMFAGVPWREVDTERQQKCRDGRSRRLYSQTSQGEC